MVVPFYALNYINDYKVNDSLYLKINAAYKGGLFVWECYYGLKSIVHTTIVTMVACLQQPL